MRRALLFLLVSSVALGQADGTIIRRRDLLGGSSVTPTAAQTTNATRGYFVATTGSDSNSCLSVSAPCLTVAGALGKIPKNIYNPTTVTIGAGNFGAFEVNGFNVQPSTTSTANALVIQGTLSTATVATGSATGTLTAFAATSGATFAVATDASQTWTIDDLRGKLIEFTGGTGSAATAIYEIASNSATAVTMIALSSQSGGATTTYAIRDWGTVINTTLPATSAVVTTVSPDDAAGIRLTNNFTGSTNGNSIAIAKLAVLLSSQTLVTVSNTNRSLFAWVKLSDGNVSSFAATGLRLPDVGGVTLHGSQIDLNSHGIGLLAVGGNFTVTRSFFNGCDVQASVGGRVTYANSFFRNSTTAAISPNAAGMPGNQVISASRLDTGATGIFGIFETSGVGIRFIVDTVDISNFTTSAITLTTRAVSASARLVTGTTNGAGIVLTAGAAIQVSASTTLTGTTEVSVDGTGTTLAAMRGAVPPLVSGPYFSIIYQ